MILENLVGHFSTHTRTGRVRDIIGISRARAVNDSHYENVVSHTLSFIVIVLADFCIKFKFKCIAVPAQK